MLSDADTTWDHYNPSVRLIELEKPDEGTLGFHLTRSKWDPYPWVSSIDTGSTAEGAGLKTGDCVLEVNGQDIIGLRISEVAQLVKGKPQQVSLFVWNAGVDPQCSPEALCCGPMPMNLHRLSGCISTILGLLECPVCLNTTATPTYQCDNGHLICMRCRAKSERCPICRLRFTRGRSLLADQVYNAIIQAFDIRDDSQESRSAKMHQILRQRSNKNVPSIKITNAHTNKFLARLIGKSSSDENLASKNACGNSLSVKGDFGSGLKAKSLSSSEIFSPRGSGISRAGSINGMNRTNQCKAQDNCDSDRPISYHGSFEFLHSRIYDDTQNTDGGLFSCPYDSACSALIKVPQVFQHFQTTHEGPLIQYFKPKVKLPLRIAQLFETYVFCLGDELFFLKIISETEKNSRKLYKDARIWAWLFDNKKQPSEHQIYINLINNDEEKVLLSVSSTVQPLTSNSWDDLKDSKSGIYISSDTMNAICRDDTLVSIEIIKSDNKM